MKMPAFHVVVAAVNQRPVRPDSGASQRLSESVQAVDRCSAGSVARDDPDVAVPQTEEITCCGVRGSAVVHANSSYVGIARERVAVCIYNGQIAQNRFGFSSTRINGWNAHDSIHAPPVKGVQIIALFLPTFPRISNQHRI